MSIKIYNGLKIKTNNIFELQEIAVKMQKYITNENKKLVVDFAIEQFLKIANNKAENGIDFLVGDIIIDIQDKILEIFSKRKEFFYDHDVIFYPVNNFFLGRFFVGKNNNDFTKLIADDKIQNIELYYYFDNTDKPEEITDEEWVEREKNWINIPNKTGFRFTLSDDDCLFILDKQINILSNIVDKKEINKIVLEKVNLYLDKIQKTQENISAKKM